MDVIAAANALERASLPGAPPVLRMEVGQPATGAQGVARAAVARALTGADPLGYTEALGRPSLRARISRHYADWYGLEVDPARIAVTSGASGAFPLAFLSCFDAGDTVAMAAPYYPPYVNTLSALGMRALVLETGAETRFQLTVAMLEALRPLPAGVLVASPGNPAGTMLRPAELAEIAGWCAANGVRLISDEIYHGLNYEVGLATAAAFADAVVVNSFSKYFCMTGWRIGWMVLPETLVRPVERLAQNFSISAPHVSQIAAEAAFEGHGELLAHVGQYRRARDVLLAALPGAWRAAAPEGAFYLYVDLGPGADSVAFSTWLLAEHRIACAPGLDFDSARGGRFARFSYAGAPWAMEAAARRLRGLGGAGRVV